METQISRTRTIASVETEGKGTYAVTSTVKGSRQWVSADLAVRERQFDSSSLSSAGFSSINTSERSLDLVGVFSRGGIASVPWGGLLRSATEGSGLSCFHSTDASVASLCKGEYDCGSIEGSALVAFFELIVDKSSPAFWDYYVK